VQAALEEQAKQNGAVLKAHEESLRELHRKEYTLEKDKLVSSSLSGSVNQNQK
jgi:hypothetical protein